MKQYSGWQALFLSFWSSSLYKDVAEQWHGVGYLYLLFVVSLNLFLMTLQTQFVTVPAIKRIVDQVVVQLPNVTIDKGKLAIDKDSPYVIKETSKGISLITFDTRPKPISFAESKSFALVTSDAIYIKKLDQKLKSEGDLFSEPNAKEKTPEQWAGVQKIEFAAVGCKPDLSVPVVSDPVVSDVGDIPDIKPDIKLDINFVTQMLDASSVKEMLDTFCTWAAPVLFLGSLPFVFLYRVLQTTFYGLIGKVFSNTLKVNLSYATLVRLSSVALTPVLFLDSLQQVLLARSPAWSNSWTLLSIILALGYLYFAVRSNVSDKPQPAIQESNA